MATAHKQPVNPQQRIREHLDMLARQKAAREEAALLARDDDIAERERYVAPHLHSA